MAAQAIAKGVQISPRKVAVVAALVRGRTVADALVILQHTPRNSAKAVRSVIESARANAENNHGYKANTMKITTLTVTPGPRLKRYNPAAHGRALPFQRKTSHIRVVLEGELRPSKKAPATEGTKAEKESK